MSNLDVGGNQIKNVLSATDNNDATTYGQLQNAITALNTQISAINTAIGNLSTTSISQDALNAAIASITPFSLVGLNNWTPGTIPNLQGNTTTFTLVGVTSGDIISPSFSLALPVGVILTGQVESQNVVRVTVFNFSGVSQTLSAGTIKVLVKR